VWQHHVIRRLNRIVAVPGLLVLVLVASSVRAQDPTEDLIVGKSTKAEVRACFGSPDYETERYWSYYAHLIGPPPYPAWLREVRHLQRMVVFEFNDRGVFLRRSYTGWPSP
jgi:hypothetical protein